MANITLSLIRGDAFAEQALRVVRPPPTLCCATPNTLPATQEQRSKDQQLFTATSRVGPNNALHGSILFLRQVSVESCWRVMKKPLLQATNTFSVMSAIHNKKLPDHFKVMDSCHVFPDCFLFLSTSFWRSEHEL